MKEIKDYLKDELEDRSVFLEPGAGEAIAAAGGKITLKVTSDMSNDQFGLYEIMLEPGSIGARLHYHRFMDETFIVYQGTLTLQLQDKEIQAPQGAVVYVPRFTPHGFSNTSDAPVTLGLLFHPGQQREGFFHGLGQILTEQPVNAEHYLALYNKYDSHPVDKDNMLPVKS